MKKIVIMSLFFIFAAASLVQAQGYVYSSASNDEKFNSFDATVSSYDNALMVVVQTYDRTSRLQTIDDVKVSMINNRTNEVKEETVKTPYLKVIADYKDFKSKYDFATANSKKYMLEENPDTSYIVKVEANLQDGRDIRVLILDQKKVLMQQTAQSFPFLFASACKTRYSDAIKDEDKSIDNSGLNDWKDYIGGPKIIKK